MMATTRGCVPSTRAAPPAVRSGGQRSGRRVSKRFIGRSAKPSCDVVMLAGGWGPPGSSSGGSTDKPAGEPVGSSTGNPAGRPSVSPGISGSSTGKPGQSTVEKLHAAEAELAAMFVPGGPQPKAKTVSLKRKEIKLLREELMQEVASLMPPGSREVLSDHGRPGKHIETVEDREALRKMAEKPSAMSPEELREIMRLEKENQELRERATAALMRLDFLENLKAAMEEKQNGIGEM